MKDLKQHIETLLEEAVEQRRKFDKLTEKSKGEDDWEVAEGYELDAHFWSGKEQAFRIVLEDLT